MWVLLVFLAFCKARALDPQQSLDHFGHQVWHSHSGLPQNTVHTLLQSQEGYLWLGTEGGLVRYDGVDFVTFNTENTPALKSDLIYDLREDGAGSLWISTAAGLVRYRDGTFTAYLQGLPAETVWFSYEDSHHRLWAMTAAGPAFLRGQSFVAVAGAGSAAPLNRQGLAENRQGQLWLGGSDGVFAIDTASAEPHVLEHLLSGSQAGPVLLDTQGAVWIGTSQGLARYAGNQRVPAAPGSLLDKTEVTALHQDGAGGMWVGTVHGLAHVGANGQTQQTGSSQESGRVDHLFRDREGVLWVAAEHGVFRLIAGQPLTSAPALAGSRVLSMYEDREGDLWLGTDGGGLHLMRDQMFTTYTTHDGLSSNRVACVLQSAEGDVWVGTDGAGLNRLIHQGPGATQKEWIHYTVADGLSSNVILSLAGGANGDLWIGTPDGLNLLHAGQAGKAGKVEKFTSADGLPDDFIRSLYTDPDGSLWVGTRHGLAHRVGAAFTNFSATDGLGSDFIGALGRPEGDEHREDLWVGTSGGLSRLHGTTFSNSTVAQGLSNNVVTAMTQSEARPESPKAMWLGTNGGGLNRMSLAALAPSILALPAGGQGLPETIYGLLDDGRGQLWLSAKTGVFRVGLAQLNAYAAGTRQPLEVTAYDTADGMNIRECSGGGHPAAWKLHDGSLWFATLDGVSAIDPAAALKPHVPPPVVVEKVLVNDRVTDLHGELTLPPGANRLEFQYAGLSFAAPQKVRYRYQLEGFDHGWIDAGNRRAAFYTNLPPAHYRFRVVAANNDGVWNTEGATFALRLLPHYYQAWWFYAAIALLCAMLGYGVYRGRVLQVEAQFGAVLAERGRLAREIHDTLAQGFVGVSVQLEVLARLFAKTSEASGAAEASPVLQQLDQTRALVRASLEDARASIWNLRGQAGLPLDAPADLPARLSQACNRMASRSETRVYLQVKGTYRPVDPRMEDELLRIGQEAVTNALHHAAATRVDVLLVYEAKRVSLEVLDDGRGFTLSPTRSGPPGHYGIRGMHERASEIDAVLSLASTPGAGTRVLVEAPLG